MTLESEWLFLGESAALGTAAMFAVVSILFSLAARETSAFAVNLARITLAVPLLLVFTVLTQSGAWWETLSLNRTLILALSGWIGLTLGDWALFSSFARLGPRVPTLMMTLAPPITAFLAVPLLGETLGWIQIGGMVVTLAGVVWVVLERAPVGTKPHADLALGLSLAFLGATAQGTGLVLSKMGMAGEVDPLPATLVRMVAAMIGAWILVIVQRKWGELGSLLRSSKARWTTAGATVLGPFLGVWLSLVAVTYTKAGVAATLMAIVPILVLPLVRWVFKERITARAFVGALIAVLGVAILTLG